MGQYNELYLPDTDRPFVSIRVRMGYVPTGHITHRAVLNSDMAMGLAQGLLCIPACVWHSVQYQHRYHIDHNKCQSDDNLHNTGSEHYYYYD